MLRMGKNPAEEEADPDAERTYSYFSPYQIEKAPVSPNTPHAFATQPGQKRHTETDPYRLVGTEITVEDPDGWRSAVRLPTEKLRLLKYVGAGGMGAVFYSVSPLRGPIAIKVLKPDIVHKFPEYVDLFSREVAAVKSLNHPNIVKFLGSGRMIEGYPFIAVEWLEGKTLDQHLTIQLPTQRVLTLFEQIGSALALAHNLKIIHLDLKPENIFVIPAKEDGSEIVKVIDFGISRVLSTYSGTTFTRFGGGSLQYCSPEQFGGKVSARSDIFSLGVMLYHMLAGALPIGGTYIAAKQSPGPLPQLPPLAGQNKDINADVEGVIAKAIQKDPSDRYQSVDELLGSLRAALGFGHPKDATPNTRKKTSDTTRSRKDIRTCPTCNAKNRVNERAARMSQPVCGGCGEKLSFSRKENSPASPERAETMTGPGNPRAFLDTRLRVALQEMLDQKRRVDENQNPE